MKSRDLFSGREIEGYDGSDMTIPNCWASKRLNNFDNWPSGSTEVKKLLFSDSLNFNSKIIETIEASQLLDIDWVIA